MANKFKKINKAQRKKEENDSTLRMAVGLGAIAIVIILIVFVFTGKNSVDPTQPPPLAGGTGQLEQAVKDAENAAAANPGDLNIQVTLGNAYYDLAAAYQQSGNPKNVEYYAKAVEPYQKALAAKFDINVQTDLATAAFYGNKPDIADQAFKKAIAQQPDFYTARLNYGIFLKEAKGDKAGAKEQFDYVAKKANNAEFINRANEFLKGL